jgi:hypothetical protein
MPTCSRRCKPVNAATIQQIAVSGRSVAGLPTPWVYEGSDGVLVQYNGGTRATRIAKLAPGTIIRVELDVRVLALDLFG